MLTFWVRAAGIEATTSSFRQGIRAFQRAKAKQMREAAQLVKRHVVAHLQTGAAGLKMGTGRLRKDSSGRRLGPLAKKIQAKVRATSADVVAVIGPSRLAFYGRFHETGVSKAVTRRRKDGTTGRTYQMRLPARPFLEPVATQLEPQIVEIIGDSYDVFAGGTAIRSGIAGGPALTGRAASWAQFKRMRSQQIASAYRARKAA